MSRRSSNCSKSTGRARRSSRLGAVDQEQHTPRAAEHDEAVTRPPDPERAVELSIDLVALLVDRVKRVTASSLRLRWNSVSRAAASARMSRAQSLAPAGPGAPRCRLRPGGRAAPGSRAVAYSPGPRPCGPRSQPRTIRSTWAAVPDRPTASKRASVSGVATRVKARTLAYGSSVPRMSDMVPHGMDLRP
jgi:hypothetical protein